MSRDIFHILSEINLIKYNIKEFRESMIYNVIKHLDKEIELSLINRDVHKLNRIKNQLYDLSKLLLSYNPNQEIINERWENELKQLKK